MCICNCKDENTAQCCVLSSALVACSTNIFKAIGLIQFFFLKLRHPNAVTLKLIYLCDSLDIRSYSVVKCSVTD